MSRNIWTARILDPGYGQKRVAELRQDARELGLSAAGWKQELLTRLQQWTETQTSETPRRSGRQREAREEREPNPLGEEEPMDTDQLRETRKRTLENEEEGGEWKGAM